MSPALRELHITYTHTDIESFQPALHLEVFKPYNILYQKNKEFSCNIVLYQAGHKT